MKTAATIVVVVFSVFAVYAQTGPCTKQNIQTIKAGKAMPHRMNDIYFYSGAMSKPAVGDEARRANLNGPARKNEHSTGYKPEKIDASPGGNMAYEYGKVHLSFDEAASGKHHEIDAAYLAVWKADGNECKIAAMIAEPIEAPDATARPK